MVKDEIDLYADVKWLEIQFDYFEAQKTRVEKELKERKEKERLTPNNDGKPKFYFFLSTIIELAWVNCSYI